MSPSIPSAQIKLSYPLYGADFDPLNQDFLLVGGGGGSTSSGVPNKLSLIDTSRRHDLSEVVDVELSKNEDSVASLAVAQSSETSLTAFAGINSSLDEQAAGNNEHFRSFSLSLPLKRTVDGTASEKTPQVTGNSEALGRTSYFKVPAGGAKDTYQRILRLSPPATGASKRSRITAIASGLASESEIVLLAGWPSPRKEDEVARLNLGTKEAVDLDFLPVEDEIATHTLAYCSDYEVSLYQVSGDNGGVQTAPIVLYTRPEASGAAGRPKFRALRFLSPKLILLLQNQPDRAGAELVVLKLTSDLSSAGIVLQKRLSKSMKLATGLDVCMLSESPMGERQILVAVAGQNNSVELLTLEYSTSRGLSTFRPYTILRNVHSGPITRIVFSSFNPPQLPASKDTRPQSVKLASVGVDQNVIVHTFPLQPLPPTSKNPRYVLVPPGGSETLQTTFSIFMAIFVIAIAAFLLQTFSEIRGAVPPTLGASDWLPPRLKDVLARPYIFADGHGNQPVVPEILSSVTEKISDVASDLPSVERVTQKLEELVSQQSDAAVAKAIVVRDTGAELSTELHHDAEAVQQETVRKWEDLHEHERIGWRKRLSDAGHWSADQGETVLKGVFFSELAGFVGEIVRG